MNEDWEFVLQVIGIAILFFLIPFLVTIMLNFKYFVIVFKEYFEQLKRKREDD